MNAFLSTGSLQPGAQKSRIFSRAIVWVVGLLSAAGMSGTLSAASESQQFDVAAFGRLPMVFDGRHQPMDSLARNSLLQIREKQTIPTRDGGTTLSATEWMMEVMMRPSAADDRRAFRVDHPELISLLALPLKASAPGEDGKHYSWNQIEPRFKEVEDQRRRILDTKKDASQRDAFDNSVLRLYNALTVYLRLKNSIHPQDTTNLTAELARFTALLPPGKTVQEAIREKYTEANIESARNDPLFRLFGRFYTTVQMEVPLLAPPDSNDGEWARIGQRLLNLRGGEPIPTSIANYARISDAFMSGDAGAFREAVSAQQQLFATLIPRDVSKSRHEFRFNSLALFYKSLVLYVVAFLFAALFWFNVQHRWRRIAFGLVGVAWVIHTGGLIYRMALEGRPPVTNLYSSAIFIGWGAVVLGMVLERFWRNSIGLVVASALGFVSLIIAHHLSLSGDTMIMLQAVLDTNFWLATHVVVVTLGYASTFVAGFLAIVYVVRGVFTSGLDSGTRKAISRMVYGIVCFATLFSFVGTVLGGIWADQSWGRFWGWDPKENGALIIVLWNALVLHARWGGLVRERGLMNLVIVGNIVTAWSWFGVNMLGIGLHSYGFMGAAFKWLAGFVVLQLLLIALGSLPVRYWKSLANDTPAPPTPQPRKKRQAVPA